MTGGGGTKIATPEEMASSPEPTFIEATEIGAAKKKVRKRKRGREANILAGRMMTERTSSGQQILG
jgi:hypothetical protein